MDEDRAIVSDFAGTTRDTIEEFVIVNDVPLKIVDTAGIRETDDQVEKIGVDKALKLIKEADLIISIFDSSKPLTEEDYKIIDLVKNKKTIYLLNKFDLSEKNTETINYISNLNKNVLKASMKEKMGLDELYKMISDMFKKNEIEINDGIVITNVRHKNLIHKAMQSIEKAQECIGNDMTIDIIAIYIKETLENLGEITGNNVSEDIINKIFSKFCLGK